MVAHQLMQEEGKGGGGAEWVCHVTGGRLCGGCLMLLLLNTTELSLLLSVVLPSRLMLSNRQLQKQANTSMTIVKYKAEHCLFEMSVVICYDCHVVACHYHDHMTT